MADCRRCYIYLPDEKKLELKVQLKTVGREIKNYVYKYFNLKEKEYFGVCYKSIGGHYAWLQDDKPIKEHDFAKKSSKYEFYFAVRHFVEKVVYLKNSLTVELFYLYLKSLVQKNLLPINGEIAFKLAAYILQVNFGDYTNDVAAYENFRRQPLLPDHILHDYSTNHCEHCVVNFYKNLKGTSKGTAILRYIVNIEILPSYGIHYYKIKDKSGNLFWLGLSFKGIFQFDIDNRHHPVKTFFWQQIDNLYFREKKFTIEVADRLQRRSSAGSKTLFAVQPTTKSVVEVKSYSWYGNPALIKAIWHMSISQHKFYLDNRKKAQAQDYLSLTKLADDLTNNNNSLISSKTNRSAMTRINDVDQRNKKGNEESAKMMILKKSMSHALQLRRTELEDKLFDKVQELKKLCLQEAEIIGKIPPEYVRYMDLNEKAPKIKKRVGAEYKVKLKKKESGFNDRDALSSATATSTLSSGFGSEVSDSAEELNQLEQEFEILSQIANAAKKLATDSKGKIKKKRWSSFQKTFDKLQEVENRINILRKKIGKKPSVRVSMLITPEDEILFEEGRILIPTESEHSSLSDGILLEDNTSLSSAGDARSITPRHKHSSSAVIDRSATPPPSFDRSEHARSFGLLRKDAFHFHKPLVPSPQSSSGVSMDSASHVTAGNASPRNWTRPKWQERKANHNLGWNESSLDSIETASTASRQSESSNRSSRDEFPFQSVNQNRISKEEQEKLLISELARISLNHNRNQSQAHSPAVGINDSKLSRSSDEIDGTPVQESFIKGNKKIGSFESFPNASSHSSNAPTERFRRRSSSLTEPSKNLFEERESEVDRSKNGTLKSVFQPEYLYGSYNVQNPPYSSSPQRGVTTPGLTSKSRSAKNLVPPPTPPKLKKNTNPRPVTPSTPGADSRTSATSAPAIGPKLARSPHFISTLPNAKIHHTAVHHHHRPTTNPPFYPASPIDDHQSTTASQPPRQFHSLPEASPEMTSVQRDQLNNEVYQDIGMGWVPSLHEYGSRASVCESVQSRKEDILRLVESCIARRNSSTSNSYYTNRDYKRMRKMREQYVRSREQQDPDFHKMTSSRDKTWADYQKQPVYSGSNDQQSERENINQKSPLTFQASTKPRIGPPPPYKPPNISLPPNSQPPPHQPVREPQHPGHHSHAASDRPLHVGHLTNDLKQQILVRHYLHHGHVSAPKHDRNGQPIIVSHPSENVGHPFAASSDGQQFYAQQQHLVAQTSENKTNSMGANGSSFEQISFLFSSNPDPVLKSVFSIPSSHGSSFSARKGPKQLLEMPHSASAESILEYQSSSRNSQPHFHVQKHRSADDLLDVASSINADHSRSVESNRNLSSEMLSQQKSIHPEFEPRTHPANLSTDFSFVAQHDNPIPFENPHRQPAMPCYSSPKSESNRFTSTNLSNLPVSFLQPRKIPFITLSSGGTLPRKSKSRPKVDQAGSSGAPQHPTERWIVTDEKPTSRRSDLEARHYPLHPSLPIDPYSRFPQGVVYDSNSIPPQYPLTHDGHAQPYSTRTLRRLKKQSASADDLSWPNDGESDPGTLV